MVPSEGEQSLVQGASERDAAKFLGVLVLLEATLQASILKFDFRTRWFGYGRLAKALG
jgi:hypothetical protein